MIQRRQNQQHRCSLCAGLSRKERVCGSRTASLSGTPARLWSDRAVRLGGGLRGTSQAAKSATARNVSVPVFASSWRTFVCSANTLPGSDYILADIGAAREDERGGRGAMIVIAEPDLNRGEEG